MVHIHIMAAVAAAVAHIQLLPLEKVVQLILAAAVVVDLERQRFLSALPVHQRALAMVVQELLDQMRQVRGVFLQEEVGVVVWV
jgi:hypothetical protein